MTKIFTKLFALLFPLALACGGVDNGELFDDAELGDGGDELGQVEQAYGAKESATTQFGTQAAGMRCNKTSTGQVCSFLRAKPTVRVCVDHTLDEIPVGAPNPLTSLESAWAGAAAARVDAATSSYSFDYMYSDAGFGCATTGASGNHIVIRNAALAGPSSSNNVNDFAKPVFSDTTGLSEGSGVVGSYQSAGNCIVHFDAEKCAAKGLSSAEDERFCANAAGFAIAGCLGMGGQNVAQGQRITRATMNGGTFNDVFSTAEQCQLTSVQLTNDGTWVETTPACNGD